MYELVSDFSWYGGLLHLPWWGYVLVGLGLTHVTIVSVTVYLHRHQAHRAVDLHPVASHFFRFWLWLTTGMVTREWVAIHRKHHAKCETPEDPHSPQTRGIATVLWQGAELYQAEAANRETLEQYGHHTPDDWLERNVYARYPILGVSVMLVADYLLFGFAGVALWGVQMLWIPFWAAGVINGLGHWWGYRNYETVDASRNISWLGVLIGGEELHNNHHAFPTSAKFSIRWWEFDIGWLYIRLFQLLGLARVRRELLGYVLQSGGLLPFLNVRRNIGLPRRLKTGRPGDIADLAERMGLGGLLDKKPRYLSGGQRQRVAILRAIGHRPSLILADEPTAAVDRSRARAIVSDFRDLAKAEGCAIAMVSHDQQLVQDFADRSYGFQVESPSADLTRSTCRPDAKT